MYKKLYIALCTTALWLRNCASSYPNCLRHLFNQGCKDDANAKKKRSPITNNQNDDITA